jgi:hypothetical protein
MGEVIENSGFLGLFSNFISRIFGKVGFFIRILLIITLILVCIIVGGIIFFVFLIIHYIMNFKCKKCKDCKDK